MTLRVSTPLRIARELMRERARNESERRQWTALALAQSCGVDQSHLSRIETLRAKCTPAVAERIAAAFPRDVLTELHLLYPERYMRGNANVADALRAQLARRVTGRKAREMEPITLEEFCAAFHINKWTFYRMRRDGTAPAFIRVGRKTLFLPESVRRWARARLQSPPEKSAAA